MDKQRIAVKQATIDKASDIAGVIDSVVDEKRYSSLRRFSVEEESRFLESLSEREAVFIAYVDGRVVGIQSITRFAQWSESMDHVGNILTMVLKEYRGRGIGRAMASRTLEFARSHGYEKIATYIIEDNLKAIEYYTKLGFEPVGKWKKQVKINGIYHDDVVMEMFL